ncbi:MAG: EF-P beta-lysylation protein EpmB [Gammaproteobacteria bacterium]|nr:EF-P beta-lysylation protein EpmB [Gammaproteobacteria bacterium]
MITVDEPHWQSELAAAYTDPQRLLARLGIAAAAVPLAAAPSPFPMRVPESFVRRMRVGDPSDPLLLQVLHSPLEDLPAPGYGTDPVGDLQARASGSTLHKYHGRILVIATGACAIHCRYCFRRHFPYGDFALRQPGLEDILAYLSSHPDIDEVILSGGDPLSLSDERLAPLLETLGAMPQVRRLRLHTRLPVVVGQRVTGALLGLIRRVDAAVVVVIHANHPNELDGGIVTHLRRLAGATALLLNQSVLLRGVNDSTGALTELSHRLFEARVMPYYLHQLDPVAGAAHFQVDDATALRLMEALRARLPGYLVPRLVRERPGAPFKIPLEESIRD